MGALRAMQSEVEITRKARISKNHQALYTVFRLTRLKTWAQKGPNWFT